MSFSGSRFLALSNTLTKGKEFLGWNQLEWNEEVNRYESNGTKYKLKKRMKSLEYKSRGRAV
jgi:hypothetical protein